MRRFLHNKVFGHHYTKTWYGFECACGQKPALVQTDKGPRFKPPFTRRDQFARYSA